MVEKVKLAQGGDSQAFTDLFIMYQELIYSIAFTYVKTKENALDVVQQTAYHTYLKIERLRKPENFKAWLCKIAIHNAMDFLRKNKKYDLNNGIIDEIAEKKEDEEMQFLDLLLQLEEKEKTVVYYKIYFEYTFIQVAGIMKIPENTVKSIYYRALEKLRCREELLL
ncbi:MAG: hypothetical protein BGN88_04125 [Clostridiales bacterium 43-6]|nr:MAG: hypothetical protein BGN88_04125 [Clostridiales bacterium 43-6]